MNTRLLEDNQAYDIVIAVSEEGLGVTAVTAREILVTFGPPGVPPRCERNLGTIEILSGEER